MAQLAVLVASVLMAFVSLIQCSCYVYATASLSTAVLFVGSCSMWYVDVCLVLPHMLSARITVLLLQLVAYVSVDIATDPYVSITVVLLLS